MQDIWPPMIDSGHLSVAPFRRFRNTGYNRLQVANGLAPVRGNSTFRLPPRFNFMLSLKSWTRKWPIGYITRCSWIDCRVETFALNSCLAPGITISSLAFVRSSEMRLDGVLLVSQTSFATGKRHAYLDYDRRRNFSKLLKKSQASHLPEIANRRRHRVVVVELLSLRLDSLVMCIGARVSVAKNCKMWGGWVGGGGLRYQMRRIGRCAPERGRASTRNPAFVNRQARFLVSSEFISLANQRGEIAAQSDWTVGRLKEELEQKFPGKIPASVQRLFKGTQLLSSSMTLEEASEVCLFLL